MSTTTSRVGRPPVSEDMERQVIEMLTRGVPPRDIPHSIPVGQTKVYEIRRELLKKKAQESTPEGVSTDPEPTMQPTEAGVTSSEPDDTCASLTTD